MSVQAGIISADELRLVVPLTPSRNDVDGWYFMGKLNKIVAWKRAARVGVQASLATIWPGGELPHRPWADHIVISIIRCTDTQGSYDADNTIGGCKAAADALVKAGIVRDDTERYVSWDRTVETRTKGNWGKLGGPATHLIVRRAEPPRRDAHHGR